MAEQGPPEYLTVLRHIADINSRIQPADLPSFSSELLQAGLITDATHRDAIAITGSGPGQKIASLTAGAIAAIKTTPNLFSRFVEILETRDKQLASTLLGFPHENPTSSNSASEQRSMYTNQ